ncbi:uncharacterized protein LOC118202672 [Stegodyphus dumicola]|uniref:uncharacterized protein LOC118202672 n=1 Tax=Stegodyphus dumicola TaxID=202533 RepID=UPI0015A9E698|nr:uncharacterized protein LOC118202672 [Stegodyphus dumicola]
MNDCTGSYQDDNVSSKQPSQMHERENLLDSTDSKEGFSNDYSKILDAFTTSGTKIVPKSEANMTQPSSGFDTSSNVDYNLENQADHPLEISFAADLIMKGCSLKSEEIPFLMGEKTSSDSDDNLSSDLDASTAMIYAPLTSKLSGQASGEDISLESLSRQKYQYYPSFNQKQLDKNILISWLDDSSDECEPFLLNDSVKRTPQTDEPESDMEEFNENMKETIFFKQNQLEKDSFDSNNSFNSANNRSCPFDTTNKNENFEKKSNLHNQNETTLGIQTMNVRKKASILTQLNDQMPEAERRDTNMEKKNNVTDFFSSQNSFEDTNAGSTYSRFKSVLSNEDMNNQSALRGPTDEENLLHESEDVLGDESEFLNRVPKCGVEKTECFRNKVSKEGTSEDGKQLLTTDETVTHLDYASKTAEEKSGNPKTESKDGEMKAENEQKKKSVAFNILSLKQTAVSQEDEKKDNLGMEPMGTLLHDSKSRESQSDLTAALRFMTEAYPSRDGNEGFTDTLDGIKDSSTFHLPEKDSPPEVVVYEEIRPIQDVTGNDGMLITVTEKSDNLESSSKGNKSKDFHLYELVEFNS